MRLGVDFHRVLTAFLASENFPGGSEGYLNDVNTPEYLFKSSLFVIQTAIGDGFMIYRLSVVWARNYYVLILPILLYMGGVATGIGVVFEFSQVTSSTSVFLITLGQWAVSFVSITLALNTFSTLMIAYRIWSINRKTGVGRDLRPVVIIIVESGALYSATLITLITLYEFGNFGHYVMLDIASALIGITFTMIIIRVSLGLAPTDAQIATSKGTSSGSTGSTAIGSTYSRGHISQYSTTRPPKPVSVSVKVEQDDYNAYQHPYKYSTNTEMSTFHEV